MNETPIERGAGRSSRRERIWGIVGGSLGVGVGLGSALIAIFVEGADAYRSVPYPPFFTIRRILVYDAFLAVVIAAGAALLITAVIAARRSRFPRTDAAGGAGVGAILVLLGAALLFTRLFAIING